MLSQTKSSIYKLRKFLSNLVMSYRNRTMTLLTVALNAVNLISVLGMNIINCENRKETNFVLKFLFCCPS